MSKAVRKIALVAAGAALGFVTGGIGFALVGGAVGLFVGSQQDAALKTSSSSSEPSAQTVRSSKAPARFILGRTSTGGVLAWAQEQSGAQTDGEWVHLVYVLCEGAVDGLESIYLGEEEIETYGAYATYELVVDPSQVNAFLKANCADWKDSQIGRGLSFVRLSLQYNAEKFPSGIPDVRFVVRGRNDIYDPRSGSTGYSANTALHLLWYLRARCKVPDDEIIFETFASAANVSDEAVTNPDGSVSQRYRTGCVIGADEQRTQVIQKLEESCAGQLIRVGGKWMLQVGAYYGPYDFEITEDMVIGTVSGSTEVNNDSAINVVTGTFIDPSQAWAETDFPEVRIEEWVKEDGGEASESMSLGYVTDPYQPQRLANIKLRRQRAGGSLQLPMNFLGYNCRPGRVVRVNLPSLNILGEFIVTDWAMASDDGCTVTVSQYEAAIFDDAVGQPFNPIGFINLPAGGLGSPTNLAWTPSDHAEVVQGVLSWTQPSGIVTEYAVVVRQGTAVIQAQTLPAPTTQANIAALPAGNYTMSVASIGPLARSGEVTITVSVSGPPIPEACVVQSTIDAITLIPSNTLHGLNGGTYEYFFSTNAQDSAADAEYLGQGLSFTHTGLAFYTNYYYFVRSSNAYGKSAFLSVPAATSNDVSAFLAAVAGKIDETALAKELKDRIDLIDGPPSLPGSVSDRLNELGTQVTEVTNQLQDQITAIGDIADSAAYDPDKAYTVGQSVLASDGKLYQAKGDVPANNPPPNTTYWTDVGQAVTDANGLAARVTTTETRLTSVEGVNTSQASQIDGLQSSLNGKADASALNSLTTRVSSAEGTISSQGTALTGLNNSLTATNTNVTAAQTAATNAATLAGSKGKTMVQTATPAAADQLAQNLWIDITGGANTPKRWNGSAWAAVTDKVATDAAAAAANALAVANTKADASTVSALTNTVTQQGDQITAQGTALTSINATLSNIGGNGSNLMPAEWSVFGPVAPVTNAITTSGLQLSTEADTAANNGYALKFATISTNQGAACYLHANNNVSSFNMTYENKKYIISFWARADVDGHQIRAWLRCLNSASTAVNSALTTFTLTTSWARYSAVVDLSNASTFSGNRMSFALYPNYSGVSGRSVYFDRIMTELQVGTGTAPSTFVTGNSFLATTANAAATSALDARVTQTETGLTSQGSQITSLTNSVAGKADNSALQALASTVSQQGSTLDSQGTAVTQLQSTIGAIAGAGTNLLPDDYSWLTSTTLPATAVNTLTRIGVAVAAAASGFGIKMTMGSAVTSQYLMLAPSNNAAGYNIDLEAGSYLVSMYVQGSAAGTMRISMYSGSHRYSSNVAFTTTRQRLVFVCTATAFARAAITIYPNMAGLPAGTEITIDSVMIEEQVGTGTAPSAFVAGPSARAIAAQATAISTLDTRVTQTETTITAQATRLDGLYVQVNPATAGDTTAYAGSNTLFAGVWSEQSARIEDGVATSKRIDTVQATVNDTSATVQQTSQAVATLDGKVSASWSVKLQVNANGQYVAAGVGLGIENTDAGLQSQFLVSADRFAIVGTLAGGTSYTPFVVQGGQVFINSAFIQDGTITNAMIGSYLQSTNYVAGSTGWRLDKSGNFEINGNVAGQGKMVITNQAIKVYDANGVKRVQLGNLSV